VNQQDSGLFECLLHLDGLVISLFQVLEQKDCIVRSECVQHRLKLVAVHQLELLEQKLLGFVIEELHRPVLVSLLLLHCVERIQESVPELGFLLGVLEVEFLCFRDELFGHFLFVQLVTDCTFGVFDLIVDCVLVTHVQDPDGATPHDDESVRADCLEVVDGIVDLELKQAALLVCVPNAHYVVASGRHEHVGVLHELACHHPLLVGRIERLQTLPEVHRKHSDRLVSAPTDQFEVVLGNVECDHRECVPLERHDHSLGEFLVLILEDLVNLDVGREGAHGQETFVVLVELQPVHRDCLVVQLEFHHALELVREPQDLECRLVSQTNVDVFEVIKQKHH